MIQKLICAGCTHIPAKAAPSLLLAYEAEVSYFVTAFGLLIISPSPRKKEAALSSVLAICLRIRVKSLSQGPSSLSAPGVVYQ
ncbi:hypothetical protein NL676_026128 [Syzygium grande]|nr:hypothetical protein NL676_026128 [Syzygium grande]